jgi:hypothetical protein
MSPDADILALQLGRPPRGRWRVVSRCAFGRPRVIAMASRLEDGAPFPTAFWLTCPHLSEAVAALESAGATAEWTLRIAADTRLATAALSADAAYRAARAAEGGGGDACPDVGVAGQADPLVVKCLHARLAARLAGIDDPVGEGVIAELEAGPGTECGDDRCGRGP